MAIKSIIKLSRTTDDQLLTLAKQLGVQVDQIDFKHNIDKHKDYAILNMGNTQIGGTHWCAISNKDKAYFDPLGLPRPRSVPSDYKYKEIMVQNPQFGHCGQYCTLWLHYLQHGKLDSFYKLFEKHSSGSLLDDDTRLI